MRGVAYLSQWRVFDPEVDIERVSTMNKRQRQILNPGVLDTNGHDDAIRSSLNLRATNDVEREAQQ